MKLFSKLKDYNNLLEEILEQKTFSSIAKSLLLSMVYKLEISYRDYSKVNVDAISKDEFLGNIVKIIKKYCDNIKTVEPETSQANLLIKNNVQALTNSKERSILTYPTEVAMLYAISDIEPKYFFIKKDFIFKNTLQRALVDAYKHNTVSILKEFNGWSWDINLKEEKDYTINLIYQNIMMIKGEKFLYDWRTDNKAQKDYLSSLKRTLKSVTANDEYFICLCKVLAKKSNKSEEKKELEKKENLYQNFLKQSDEFKKENAKEFKELENYHEIFICEKTEFEQLINLQECFLEYFDKKISKMTLREEIIQAIYQIRLYQNLILTEGKYTKNCPEIKKQLDVVLKNLITKACKLGVIKIISMDIENNYKILKFILDTKIINLEEIKISLELEESQIYIKVYDKEIFEKQGKIKFSGNKKDVAIRKNKKIKLFN